MPNWTIEGLLENIGLKRAVSYGIALSGGGARGFAHVGVMMALEKFGIRPSVISGVSAGAIAAVMYSSGLTPREIIDCFGAYNKFTDFTEWCVPREGFFRLNRFAKILDSWLPVKNLEDLNVPTVICATDFENGRAIGWFKGSIVERVVASCSIPMLFTPVMIDGVGYVDGGVLRNLPAWAIRKHCKTLIGSNCSPLDRTFKYKGSMIDIALRSYQLTTKANVPQDLKLCDIVIQSEGLSNYKTFSIKQMRQIVMCGYDAACVELEKASFTPNR